MGMDAGTTAGPGITAKQRLQAIGGGWDINVTSVLLKHLKPRSVHANPHMYLAKLATSATKADMEQGEHFLNLFQGDMEKVATYSLEVSTRARRHRISWVYAGCDDTLRECGVPGVPKAHICAGLWGREARSS